MKTKKMLPLIGALMMVSLACGEGPGDPGGAGGMGGVGGSGGSGGAGGTPGGTVSRIEIGMAEACRTEVIPGGEKIPEQYLAPLAYKGAEMQFTAKGFDQDGKEVSMPPSLSWEMVPADMATIRTNGSSSWVTGMQDAFDLGTTAAPTVKLTACVEQTCSTIDVAIERNITGSWQLVKPQVDQPMYVEMHCRVLDGHTGRGWLFMSGNEIGGLAGQHGSISPDGVLMSIYPRDSTTPYVYKHR